MNVSNGNRSSWLFRRINSCVLLFNAELIDVSVGAVLPREAVRAVPLCAARDKHLPAVRCARLPQGELLQAKQRLRGGTTLDRLRRRDCRVPRRHLILRHRRAWQAGVPLGIRLSGHVRRRRQRTQVSVSLFLCML